MKFQYVVISHISVQTYTPDTECRLIKTFCFPAVFPGQDDPGSRHQQVPAARQQEEAAARRNLHKDHHGGVQNQITVAMNCVEDLLYSSHKLCEGCIMQG